MHRAECRNVQNVAEPDRLIPVSWGTPSQRYTARVSIQAWDRVGLLSDIASLLSAERVNISEVRSSHPRNGLVTETLTLRTSGAAQLSRMLQRIENIRGVVKVERRVRPRRLSHRRRLGYNGECAAAGRRPSSA